MCREVREKRVRPLWLMFSIAYVAYCSIYSARLNFSVASTLFEANCVLNKGQIGVIGSVFAFCYATAKIPNGYLGDRLSSRFVIVMGLVITGFSNLLIGFFHNFNCIAVLWGFNAFGQSMLWGPMLRSFSENYEGKTYRLTAQYLVSAVAVGSIAGLVLASICSRNNDLSACFVIPGLFSLVMAMVVQLFFLDSPGKKQESIALGKAIGAIVHKSEFRQIMFPAMAHGMIKDNINVWLALYFVDCYQTEISGIAGFIFIVPLFALAGRFLYPVFYRLVKNDYRVTALAFALATAANILLAMGKLNMAGAVLCLGADSALVSVINTFMLSQFPSVIADDTLSFAASIMDLVTYGGAGMGSVLFGFLIGKYGFQAMFFIWTAVSLISSVIMYLVRKEEEVE